MTPTEVDELLRRWHNAVSRLWENDVRSPAAGAGMECPCYSKVFDAVTVSLSARGVETSIGSDPATFDKLLFTTVFRLSDLKLIREFVVESIQKGRVEVAAQRQAREKMLKSGFDDFKKEIADWNLRSDKGQEV